MQSFCSFLKTFAVEGLQCFACGSFMAWLKFAGYETSDIAGWFSQEIVLPLLWPGSVRIQHILY